MSKSYEKGGLYYLLYCTLDDLMCSRTTIKPIIFIETRTQREHDGCPMKRHYFLLDGNRTILSNDIYDTLEEAEEDAKTIFKRELNEYSKFS